MKPKKDVKYCSNCAATIDASLEICPQCNIRIEPAAGKKGFGIFK